MSNISIDPKTYHRLQQFSQRARISIHVAASDAIENWLDIASDPHLALMALGAIAMPQPHPLPNPASLVPAALRTNVTCINAGLGSSPHRQDDTSRTLREVNNNEVAR